MKRLQTNILQKITSKTSTKLQHATGSKGTLEKTSKGNLTALDYLWEGLDIHPGSPLHKLCQPTLCRPCAWPETSGCLGTVQSSLLIKETLPKKKKKRPSETSSTKVAKPNKNCKWSERYFTEHIKYMWCQVAGPGSTLVSGPTRSQGKEFKE